ncbi:MAG: DUF2065 domain-containing protein [Syntrophobacteraceae bacterium]|jgi:hypothetical protein|nr:DUF2065 domain-containing protein [Syntrophobacteraceae bacterium]
MSKSYWLTVIGLICFFEGLPYMAAPDQLKGWLRMLLDMESRHLRALGAAMMVLGLLLVYWGQHGQ